MISVSRSAALLACLFFAPIHTAFAGEKPIFEISIKDHKFDPAVITIPANQKVKFIVSNHDKTPEEFESHDMHREKIIPGGSKATIFIGPLKPGEYTFFGEFNPATAQGKVIAE